MMRVERRNYSKKIRGGYYGLDLLKVLLACIIVLRHCGQAFFKVDSAFVGVITNTISPMGVPTFFVISGFLFFRRKRSGEDLIKYVLRVGLLYLAWTIVYMPIIIWNCLKNAHPVLEDIVRFIQSGLFEGTYYHLWYLPSLAVAILIVYLLGQRMGNRTLLGLSVVFYILGILVDTYSFISPVLEWSAYKTIFLTTRNGLFFGFIFIMIGKLIAENLESVKNSSAKKLISYLTVGIAMACLEGWLLCNVHNVKIVNMSFSSVIVAPILVVISILISNSLNCVDGELMRNISTVMFYCHPWVIFIVEIFDIKLGIAAGIETIMVMILAVISSYLCVIVSKKVKLLRVLM